MTSFNSSRHLSPFLVLGACSWVKETKLLPSWSYILAEKTTHKLAGKCIEDADGCPGWDLTERRLGSADSQAQPSQVPGEGLPLVCLRVSKRDHRTSRRGCGGWGPGRCSPGLVAGSPLDFTWEGRRVMWANDTRDSCGLLGLWGGGGQGCLEQRGQRASLIGLETEWVVNMVWTLRFRMPWKERTTQTSESALKTFTLAQINLCARRVQDPVPCHSWDILGGHGGPHIRKESGDVWLSQDLTHNPQRRNSIPWTLRFAQTSLVFCARACVCVCVCDQAHTCEMVHPTYEQSVTHSHKSSKFDIIISLQRQENLKPRDSKTQHSKTNN